MRSNISVLPPEILSLIIEYTLPALGDCQCWFLEINARLDTLSSVNSNWKEVVRDISRRHVVILGNEERLIETAFPSHSSKPVGSSKAVSGSERETELSSHDYVESLHLYLPFSYNVRRLLSFLPKLKRLLIFKACGAVDFPDVFQPLEGIRQSRPPLELHFVDTTFTRYWRPYSPDIFLPIARLVLSSSELPTSCPPTSLPYLTHLAQINVTGLSSTSFDRDSWLIGLAPQLSACSFTLVGSGMSSDLPILKAMTRIQALDVIVPYAVGLSVASILGAVEGTIKHFRVECMANKFADFTKFVEAREPPDNLKSLWVRIRDTLNATVEERLVNAWGRKIELRVEQVDPKRFEVAGTRFEDLYWDTTAD